MGQCRDPTRSPGSDKIMVRTLIGEDMKTPIPQKLQSDLYRKCWTDHIDAMSSLLDAVAVFCPRACLRSQERYSALYKGNKEIFAYIEPQQNRVLFGFFRNYVADAQQRVRIRMTSFPEWNTSKGGLVGAVLDGTGESLGDTTADIAYLILESYQRT